MGNSPRHHTSVFREELAKSVAKYVTNIAVLLVFGIILFVAGFRINTDKGIEISILGAKFTLALPTETPFSASDDPTSMLGSTSNSQSFESRSTNTSPAEMTEIPTSTASVVMSPDKAISKYFLLINEALASTGDNKLDKYRITFGMLSDDFKRTRNNSNFDSYWSSWENNIGRPTILSPTPHAVYSGASNAVVTIYIRFEKDSRSCIRIPYIMIRDERIGSQEFDYWLIQDSEGQKQC